MTEPPGTERAQPDSAAATPADLFISHLRGQVVAPSRGSDSKRAAGILVMAFFYPIIPVVLAVRGAVRGARSVWTRRRRQQLIQRAAELQDPRAVGPLLILLKRDSRYVREEITATLCKLLPEVTDSAMDSSERELLSGLIRYSRDISLVLAGLDAISRCSQPTLADVYAVRSLAQRQGQAYAIVRERAGELLPRIERNLQLGEQRALLLRASSTPGAQPGVLLRPANGVGAASAAQLLRPGAYVETVSVTGNAHENKAQQTLARNDT